YAAGPRGTATLTITRIGAAEVEVWRGDVTLADHALPPDADAMGCDWPVVAAVEVDAAWPSGYYEVVVHSGDGGEAVAFLVVRPRPGRLVGLGRLGVVGAAVRPLGRGQRHRRRLRGERRPRTRPRPARRAPHVPQRRPRRVLVVGHARRGGGVRRRRRQLGVPQ